MILWANTLRSFNLGTTNPGLMHNLSTGVMGYVDKFSWGRGGWHKQGGGYPHSSQISEIRTETYKIKKYFIEARYVFKLSPI